MRIIKFEKIKVEKVVTVLLPFIIGTDYILVTIVTKNLGRNRQAVPSPFVLRTQVSLFLPSALLIKLAHLYIFCLKRWSS
ncbi:bitter taste receptor T2R38 [Bacillus cereus]|nr:bitter taste receptor T2R38 [Bacillus cereus]